MSATRRVEAATDAVQEEFDERGLGDASLLVEVILNESGYPVEVERLRDALGRASRDLYRAGRRRDAQRAADTLGTQP